MQASHSLARVSVTFDDDTLLPNGGLAVAALLAQKLGIPDLVDDHVAISGKAASGRGAATFVAETDRRVRDAGATGRLTLRADSGFYAGSVVSACRRHGVAFSVTARTNPAIQRAIDAIPDDAWTPIPYWLDGGADVAETTYAPV